MGWRSARAPLAKVRRCRRGARMPTRSHWAEPPVAPKRQAASSPRARRTSPARRPWEGLRSHPSRRLRQAEEQQKKAADVDASDPYARAWNFLPPPRLPSSGRRTSGLASSGEQAPRQGTSIAAVLGNQAPMLASKPHRSAYNAPPSFFQKAPSLVSPLPTCSAACLSATFLHVMRTTLMRSPISPMSMPAALP